MINILLVEDHCTVRSGLRILIETDPELTVAAEASNGAQALEVLNENKDIDIILTDFFMPVMDGQALLQEITARYQHAKVVFLSMLEDLPKIVELFNFQAHGFLNKNVSSNELIHAIRMIYKGNKYLCSDVAVALGQRAVPLNSDNKLDPEKFSEREIEVLELIAQGMTNAEIADQLFISRRTVEGHRQSLLVKTGAKNTAELIKAAMRSNLIR